MSLESNKLLVRRMVEDVVQGGHVELVDELFAADYLSHDPGNPNRPRGAAATKAFIAMLHTGLSDVQYIAEDMLAEGDRVMYRWTLRGTHTGLFMGVPATRTKLVVTGIDLLRLDGGQIVESWVSGDDLGLLQQLGVIAYKAPS